MLTLADQSEFISSGLVSAFLVCVAAGSSDSYRLCQLLWDSAEQTAHATRATGKWQMVSSGVDVCLLVKT